MRLNERITDVIVVSCVAIFLVVINILGSQYFVHYDLTRDNKFTLADSTVELLGKLSSPVTVTVYFSDGLPQPYAAYRKYLVDLLSEYKSSAQGKFTFEVVDPALRENDQDKNVKKTLNKDVFGNLVRESTSIEKKTSKKRA